MAIIDPVTVEAKGNNTSEAGWTGDGFASVDGILRAGPETDGADLPFAPDRVMPLEVHDADVPQYHMTPETHPRIRWRTVSTAAKYRIYHQAPAASTLSLIYEAVHQDEMDPYSVCSPVACGEGWHAFEVRAVDSSNNESTVTTWYIYVFDLPELPSDMEISGTGGSFTITLTA